MPFNNKNYRLLWLANLIASFSGHVSMLAFPLVAVQQLHATEWEMGLLVAVEVLPFVLFSLPAGTLVDRLPTHRVVVWSIASLAAVTVIVPLSDALGMLYMGFLYLAGFLMGAVMCIEGVASQVLTTELVSRKGLVQANAWLMGTESGLKLIAPAAGGVLVQTIGAPATLWCEVILLSGATLVLMRIRHSGMRERPQHSDTWPLIVEGLRAVWRSSVLRVSAAIMMVWQLLWHGVYALLVLYATRELALSPAQLGLATACGAAGVLAATLLSGRVERRLGLGRGMLIGLALAGAGWGLMALAPRGHGFAAFALAYVVMDFGLTLGFVCYISLRQAVVADALLGRVTATVRWLSLLLAPFGSALFGWLAHRSSVEAAFGSAALLCLLLTAAGAFTAIRQVRSAEHEGRQRSGDGRGVTQPVTELPLP